MAQKPMSWQMKHFKHIMDNTPCVSVNKNNLVLHFFVIKLYSFYPVDVLI